MIKRIQNQKGFTLIEVLVAFVVMTVGLLGVAGLQMTGMKSVQASVYRYQASRLAEDLLDRMRANKTAVKNGHYSLTAGTTINSLSSSTATDCTASACNSSQLAGYDLLRWANDLKSGFQVASTDSQSTVEVSCSSAGCPADSIVTIIIKWKERADLDEKKSGTQATTGSFTLNSVLI